jgi:DNA-binding CsgD family transcriptional regulator
MKYRKRIYYTEADKALMWDRWQKGDSLHAIARLFDRPHSSVRGILERTGGIRPPTRRRSSRSLTLSEREEISRGLAAGRSLRSIALRLGRTPSTISRELNRNGGLDSYRAHAAEQAAWDRACRPKRCKLALNRPLAMTVAELLRQRWSPWQTVAEAVETERREATYNLTVAEFETYFVGEIGVLVHNCNIDNVSDIPTSSDELVDLTSAQRREHILDGDATGGGHRSGTDAGKSEFPEDWTDDQVMHAISDVATDPNAITKPGRGTRTVTEGTRNGVDIKVIQESTGEIVSAWPTNTPGT